MDSELTDPGDLREWVSEPFLFNFDLLRNESMVGRWRINFSIILIFMNMMLTKNQDSVTHDILDAKFNGFLTTKRSITHV